MRWIWTGVMRASSSVALFAFVMAAMILTISNSTSAPFLLMTLMQQLSLTLKYPIKSILQHNILWQLTVCISNYGILSRTMQEVFEIFSQYLVVGKNKYRLNVVELP